MKKNGILVHVICAMGILATACLADDAPLFNSTEFAGFQWGSDLRKHPQLECKFHHMGPQTDCTLKSASPTFLGVDIEDRYYSVNSENKFDYVSMQIKDRLGWRQLRENLTKELGGAVSSS